MSQFTYCSRTALFCILTTCVSFVFAVIFYVLYSWGYYSDITLTVIFGCICYHFGMRILVVSIVIASTTGSLMTGSKRWFNQSKIEKSFCKLIRIGKWKRHMPTFFPEDYSVSDNSMDMIIHSMCLYEVSHEIMLALTFPPFIAGIFIGNWWTITITACMGGVLDILCILIQRHNRPRVKKIKALQERLKRKKKTVA